MSALLFMQALNPRQDCCPISAELFSQPDVPLQDWKPIFPTDLKQSRPPGPPEHAYSSTVPMYDKWRDSEVYKYERQDFQP